MATTLRGVGPGPLGTSEQEDVRRRQFKEEMQSDMQRFLAAQARENPRLRHLRRRQSEVTESPSKTNPITGGGGGGERHEFHAQDDRHNGGQRREHHQQREQRYEPAPPQQAYRPQRPRDEYQQHRGHSPERDDDGYEANSYPRERREPYAYRTLIPPISDPYSSSQRRWEAADHHNPHRPRGGGGGRPDPYSDYQRYPMPHPPLSEYGRDYHPAPPPPRDYDTGPRYPDRARARSYHDHGEQEYGGRQERYNAPPPGHHEQAPHHEGDRNSKAREYAADLERQIEERKRAQERERGFRHAPGYGGGNSNPITGGSERTYAPPVRTSIRMSNGLEAGGGGGSVLTGPILQTQGAPPLVSSKSEYLRELDAQIQYKRNQTEQEQHHLRLQDEKKDREIAAYNPWGRAGGGAPPAKAGAPQPLDAYAGQQQHQMPMQPQSHPSYNAAAGVGMAGYTPAPTGSVLFAGQQPPLPPIADSGDEHKFQRGQRKDMPSWERDELQKRQKLQQDHQDSLRRQMAEREATKAAAIAAQKAEDKREADRLQREHDALQEKYAREAAEEREKAEAERVEAAKKKAEMEKEQERRDQAFRERAQKGGEKSRRKRAEAAADTAQTAQPAPRPYSPPIPTHRNSVTNNPPPFRSNSPPIPAHANKSAEQHHQASTSDPHNRQPHDEHQQQPFRSSSPPIPAVRAKLEREASEHAIGPPPPQSREREPLQHAVPRTNPPDDDAMPDTRAVLQQLIAIQQELAREDAAIQSELHSRHADEEKEAPPANAQGQANTQEAATRRRASTPRKQPSNVPAAEPDELRHSHERHASSLPVLSAPPPPTIALARRSSIPNTLRLPRAKTPSLISNQRAYIAKQESSLAQLRNSERMAAAPEAPPTAIPRPSASVAAPPRPESAERARRQELINDFLAGHAAGAADDGDPAHRGLESESTLMYLNGATPKPPAPTLIRPTPIRKKTPPPPSPPSLPRSPSPTPSLDIASLTALNDRRLRTLTALKAAPTSATSAANKALLDDFLRKHVVPVSKRFPDTAAAEGHPIPAATSIYTPVIH
ncbi:hypothetical protein BDZ88DRAFT_473429 [Geranomyces variabilis]|nr:hypothetical protein BDZ88DRAFT_473429 [Geranomyces variabilis]